MILSVVNRATEDEVQPNGKGVNVSFILKMLGIHNQALGFSGGFTGKFIEEELENKDIETNFVKVEVIRELMYLPMLKPKKQSTS